jgi:hypothetical protein
MAEALELMETIRDFWHVRLHVPGASEVVAHVESHIALFRSGDMAAINRRAEQLRREQSDNEKNVPKTFMKE